jgi:F-type H+-transporting ATPase subunit b
MPQLDTSTWPSQLFWLALTFCLLYYIVSQMIIPRTGGVIEKRKSTIEGDLAAAQRLKQEAEQALKAYEASLTEARSRAGGITAEERNRLRSETDSAMAKVNAEISAKIAAAEKSIAAAKAKAMENIETIAADLSSSIVGELIGGAPIAAEAQAPAPRRKK